MLLLQTQEFIVPVPGVEVSNKNKVSFAHADGALKEAKGLQFTVTVVVVSSVQKLLGSLIYRFTSYVPQLLYV